MYQLLNSLHQQLDCTFYLRPSIEPEMIGLMPIVAAMQAKMGPDVVSVMDKAAEAERVGEASLVITSDRVFYQRVKET